MLEAVKTALGISSDVYNDEFTNLIASAKADLQLSGIVVMEDTPADYYGCVLLLPS